MLYRCVVVCRIVEHEVANVVLDFVLFEDLPRQPTHRSPRMATPSSQSAIHPPRARRMSSASANDIGQRHRPTTLDSFTRTGVHFKIRVYEQSKMGTIPLGSHNSRIQYHSHIARGGLRFGPPPTTNRWRSLQCLRAPTRQKGVGKCYSRAACAIRSSVVLGKREGGNVGSPLGVFPSLSSTTP